MSELRFISDITVRLIQSAGGDHMIIAAAKASTSGVEALEFLGPECAENNEGLINYLMKMRHGTPFEHALLTSFVHAPAMVWWEWIRHRVGMTVDCSEMSFNLESGRYKALEPVFWIPRSTRKMTPALDHKSARPHFETISQFQHDRIIQTMIDSYRAAWSAYETLLANKIANEVSRAVLGFGVYYSGWVTANPRSLMHFLSLRTHEPTAKYVSYPQAEIEEAARATEQFFAIGWPLAHKAFCKHGRVAP